jgi:hypothetical protein
MVTKFSNVKKERDHKNFLSHKNVFSKLFSKNQKWTFLKMSNFQKVHFLDAYFCKFVIITFHLTDCISTVFHFQDCFFAFYFEFIKRI